MEEILGNNAPRYVPLYTCMSNNSNNSDTPVNLNYLYSVGDFLCVFHRVKGYVDLPERAAIKFAYASMGEENVSTLEHVYKSSISQVCVGREREEEEEEEEEENSGEEHNGTNLKHQAATKATTNSSEGHVGTFTEKKAIQIT